MERTVDPVVAIAILGQGLPLADVLVSGPLTLRDLPTIETIAVPIVIRNCVLDHLDAGFIQFKAPVVLENVDVVGACIFHSCFFPAGFSATGCHFRSGIDLRWGGHNQNGSMFTLQDCQFDGFADFDDDWFRGPVSIRGCAFRGGANLFGMKGQPTQVVFDVEPTVEGNAGRLDFDEAPSAG